MQAVSALYYASDIYHSISWIAFLVRVVLDVESKSAPDRATLTT
jgi:hypothetical protein